MEGITTKKLKPTLENYYKHTREVSKKVLEELKNSSENYGDLKRNLEIFKKSIFLEYEAIEKYGNLIIEIEKMLEEEMNGLPLTSHSK